jgi:hypothetical protein
MSNYYDHFGRLEVASPITIASNHFSETPHNEIIYTLTIGTGTSSWTPGYNILTVNASGDKAVRQTRSLEYHAQRTRFITIVSTLVTSNSTNIIARTGIFDDGDDKTVDSGIGAGHFFEYNNGTMYVVERSSITGTQVDNKTIQSSWNIDKLDGTGSSGVTLDPTILNTFCIEELWHGNGACRFGLHKGHQIVWCHEISERGLQHPYTRRAALPVRWELKSSGSDVVSLNVSAFNCSIYGSKEYNFNRTSISNETNVISLTGNSYVPIIAVRIKSNHCRSIATLAHLSSNIDSKNHGYLIKIIKGDFDTPINITDGSWVNNNSQTLESNLTMTSYSGTGKTILSRFCGYGNPENVIFSNQELGLPKNVFLSSDIPGNSGIILVLAKLDRNNSSNIINLYVSLGFAELIE